VVNSGEPLGRQREAEYRRALVAAQQLVQRAAAQVKAAVARWNGVGDSHVRVMRGARRRAASLQRVAAESAGGRGALGLVLHGRSGASVRGGVRRFDRRRRRRPPVPVVGALWDTHHPYRTGETAEETYNLLASRLYHTHVKDARRDGDGWQLVLLGQGEVPVREVLSTLQRRGYDGWICVEWEKMWHPEIEEREVAFPQHLKLMREYLTQASP